MGDGKRDQAVEQRGLPAARLTRTEAVRAHATLAVGLALCLAAFIFEIKRALGGNSLSWAYVFEWPLLGAFAVYMWWKVLHPDTEEARSKHGHTSRSLDPEFDGMLAAWQAHQADLHTSREVDKHDEAAS